MSCDPTMTQVAEDIGEMVIALKKIARGRTDNGRPLTTEDSRQTARAVLLKLGMNWKD